MLNELAKEYGPRPAGSGVNYDDEGDLILTRRFIARYKPVFPIIGEAWKRAEFTQAISAGWNGALPASFFYDKEGSK